MNDKTTPPARKTAQLTPIMRESTMAMMELKTMADTYNDLLLGIDGLPEDAHVTVTPGTRRGRGSKGVGGKRTEVERRKLLAESKTYKETIRREANPNGRVWVQLRLSMKTAASEGDKAQRDQVLEMAQKLGYKPEQIDLHWEVGSAWKQGKHRAVIDEMLLAMERGELAAILAWEVSRITRDTVVARLIQDYAQRYNVPIRFVKNPDLKPELNDSINNILYVVLTDQARSESEATSMRTKRNHELRRKQGRKRGGFDPLGMRVEWVHLKYDENGDVNGYEVGEQGTGAVPIFVPDERPGEGFPAEMPTPAAVTRYIFQYVADGGQINKLAQRLNELKVPTASAQYWQSQSIKHLLRNPVMVGYGTYKGEIAYNCGCWGGCLGHCVHGIGCKECPETGKTYGRATRAHVPLIDDALYTKVQETLANRGRAYKARPKNRKYRLSGITRCGNCGDKMVGRAEYNNGKIPRSYYCTMKIENPEKCGMTISLGMDGLDDAILNLVLGLVDNPAKLAELMDAKSIEAARIEWQAEVEAVKAEIARIDEKIANTDDADVREGLELKAAKLANDLNGVLNRERTISIQDTSSLDLSEAAIRQAWENDPVAAQMIVRAIIDKIVILPRTKGFNIHSVKDLGWKCELDRAEVVFKNGERINIGAEFRAKVAAAA